MNKIGVQTAISIAIVGVGLFGILGTGTFPPTQQQVTSVGKSTTTLERFEGMAQCDPSTTPPPDVQGWWNALPTANRKYPFAGWETWRNTNGGCANTRVDTYRAVVTFNLASVAGLKGLVTKAELVVRSRALAPAAGPGGAVTAGPFGQPGSITLFCPERIGGAGALVRFGPNAVIPSTTPMGSLQEFGPTPFPAGTNVVYTLPIQFTPGPIANAANPTTVDGSGVIVTDVTSQINAALNGNLTGISWMVTSNFEGSLPGQLPAPGAVDCKTSYDFDLRLTHL